MSHAAREDATPLPWADGVYSIKRHGTSLTECASEPVQTPGCIQAHGALVTARISDLTILQVSENSEQYFGVSPDLLLGQPLSRLLHSEHEMRLQAMIASDTIEGNVLYAFTLPARADSAPLDVCVHTMSGVLILEFESSGRGADPLLHPAGDFFTPVRAAVSRMQSVTGQRAFCDCIAREVRTITGLDRVMVYRFHEDNHGEVFAESKLDELAPWLGLHYPEGDIPKPARDIYQRIWIRPLPNAAGPLIELVPLANPDTGKPLTMTYCSLRGASVMYTEYLANMGVGASLTMPILIEGELGADRLSSSEADYVSAPDARRLRTARPSRLVTTEVI